MPRRYQPLISNLSQMSLNCRYHAMVSVINLTSKNYRYCKHLCRIDRPSKLVISDYDICIFARVGIPSTYLYFSDFTYSLNKSVVGHDLQKVIIAAYQDRRIIWSIYSHQTQHF